MENWNTLGQKLLSSFPVEQFDGNKRGLRHVKFSGDFLREHCIGAAYAWLDAFKAALPADTALIVTDGVALRQCLSAYQVADLYSITLASEEWPPLRYGLEIPELVLAFTTNGDGVLVCKAN